MVIVSCSIDNYEGPSVKLSGKVIDNITNEMVENGGANSGTRIYFFEGSSKQPIITNSYPDGSFVNNALFPGDYRLVVEGAFKMVEDTVRFSLSEMHTEIEVQVLPNVRLSTTIQSYDGSNAMIKVEYSKVHDSQLLKEVGISWSTIDNPNAFTYFDGNKKVENVSAQNLTSGEIIFNITGLKPEKDYYIRAFAQTNALGGYYNYSKTIQTQ